MPVAQPLDPVQRLRVVASAIEGAVVEERVVAASATAVWDVLGDFEGGFTAVQPDMKSVRVRRRGPRDVELLATSRYGMRALLQGPVDEGYCWLASRFLIIGMAAAPVTNGSSRVALTGGVRIPRRSRLIPFGVRREARRSLDRLESTLRAESAVR